jgi:hypothetical protein
LDLIERLNPALVIPGHGAAFGSVATSLAFARQRLEGFVANPAKHLQYAAKVLLKFKLLEAQRIEKSALTHWAQGTPYMASLMQQHFAGLAFDQGVYQLLQDLVRAGAATLQGDWVHNA